jgi:hypothetical protein
VTHFELLGGLKQPAGLCIIASMKKSKKAKKRPAKKRKPQLDANQIAYRMISEFTK